MTKNKLINTILLFAALSGNAVADEVSSKAIYDSKTKTLSLEGVLVPFIDKFAGKRLIIKEFSMLNYRKKPSSYLS
jgi:hypothetical protein